MYTCEYTTKHHAVYSMHTYVSVDVCMHHVHIDLKMHAYALSMCVYTMHTLTQTCIQTTL